MTPEQQRREILQSALANIALNTRLTAENDGASEAMLRATLQMTIQRAEAALAAAAREGGAGLPVPSEAQKR